MKDLRDLKNLTIHDVQPISVSLNGACPQCREWARQNLGAAPEGAGEDMVAELMSATLRRYATAVDFGRCLIVLLAN